MIDRRALLGTVGLSGAGVVAASAIQKTANGPGVSVRTVNVRDFGAVGDGRTDDTAAFNRACQAEAEWSEGLCHAIHVPTGRYRLDGTVFVRKGQTLFGDGHATYIDARKARTSTFIMGRRGPSGRGTPDPGGAPVRLCGLHAMGGSPSHGFVATDAQGFSIADLFLTAVGIGIELAGSTDTIASDGIVSDIFIDQCLQGILIGKAQNITVNAVNIYRPKFAVTIGDGAHDIILSALSIVYTEKVALTLSGSIANILIAHSTIVSNGQHEDFIANVLLRVPTGDVLFNGCTFRNWPGTAIVQDSPGNLAADFHGCVFDGSQSSKDYDWSKASEVLSTSSAGRFSFQGCAFRNIRGAIARLPAGRARLTLTGGTMEESDERRLAVDPRFTGTIAIGDVAGFAPLRVGSGQVGTLLPLWPGTGPWRITVRLPRDDVAEEAIVHVRDTTATRVSGWRTTPDRGLRFAVVDTPFGPRLQAMIATSRPEGAVFTAETLG